MAVRHCHACPPPRRFARSPVARSSGGVTSLLPCVSRQRAHMTRSSQELRVAGGRHPFPWEQAAALSALQLRRAWEDPEAGGAPEGLAAGTRGDGASYLWRRSGGGHGGRASVIVPQRLLLLLLLPQADGGRVGGPRVREEARRARCGAMGGLVCGTEAPRAEYCKATRLLARSNAELLWWQQDAAAVIAFLRRRDYWIS